MATNIAAEESTPKDCGLRNFRIDDMQVDVGKYFKIVADARRHGMTVAKSRHVF